MSDKKYDLEDRFVGFAASIANLVRSLPQDAIGKYYGNQLLRSSGSAALNFGEAQGTNTVRDYINKATISLKELKESRVNLRIMSETEFSKNMKFDQALDEVEQLIRITATIINNKKRNL